MTRVYKLHLIENSPNHKLTLLDWTAQLSFRNDKLVRKLSSCSASLSHLYQILGFFFVFEGVIITAAAQASDKNLCRNFKILLPLSIIASVATLCACFQKLSEFADAHNSSNKEKGLCSALEDSIEQLKTRGLEFDIEDGWPTAEQSSDSPGFCKKWVLSYAGAVIAVVVAFSITTLIAVKLFLCHHI